MLVIIALPEAAGTLHTKLVEMLEPLISRERFKRSHHIGQSKILLAVLREPDNEMEMIWHDHKLVELESWVLLWQAVPDLFEKSTQRLILKDRSATSSTA